MKLTTLFESEEVSSFQEVVGQCCEAATKAGFTIQKLSNGTPIITKKGSKTLSILSGIHGDERSGPLFLSELLRKFATKEKEVPEIGLCIVPLLNDHGWDKDKRFWNSVDLNDSFKASSECKHQVALMDYYRKNIPFVHWDIHEDNRFDDPYLFQYSKDSSDLIGELSKKLDCRVEDYESLDYSSESLAWRFGVKGVVTSEVPPTWSWDEKYKWLESVFDFLVERVANEA